MEHNQAENYTQGKCISSDERISTCYCSFIDNDYSIIHCSDMYAPSGLERSVAELNRNISISQVSRLGTMPNGGKACGTDEITS